MNEILSSKRFPPLANHFDTNKASSRRPIFFCSPRENRSFYNGAFAKGRFEFSPNYLKENSLASPKPASVKVKQLPPVTLSPAQSFCADTTSHVQSKILEVDPEIVHELPYKDNLITRNQSKKLKKLLELTKPSKSITYPVPKREKRNDSLDIDSYLSFLRTTSDNLTAFSTKMHEKSDNPKVTFERLDTESPKRERQLFESQFVQKQKTKTIKPSPVLSPIKITSEDEHLPNLGGITKDSSPIILEEPEKIDPSRTSLAPSGRKPSLTLPEGKPDEAIAKELTEEVITNYKHYMSTAANSKDLNTKITRYLKEKDVLEVFTGKINRFMSLQNRIFRDMVELYEESPTKNNNGLSPHSSFSPHSPHSPHSPSKPGKMGRPAVKIILSKYQTYKSISKEFLNVVEQFKMQGIHTLQGKLLQSHQDFKQRKNELLRSLAKSNANTFDNLKTQCDNVEDMLFLYENYDLRDKVEGTGHVNRPNKAINRSLTGFMSDWKRALSNPAIES